MTKVMNEIKENPNLDIKQYIDNCINQTRLDYDSINQEVKKLYKKHELCYDADKNPFI